jgi:hypothetical protein
MGWLILGGFGAIAGMVGLAWGILWLCNWTIEHGPAIKRQYWLILERLSGHAVDSKLGCYLVTAEVVVLVLLAVVNLVYEVFYYGLLADTFCGGMGSGSTDSFRICDGRWLILALAIDYLLLLALMLLFRKERTSFPVRPLFWAFYLVYVFISPPIFWKIPFFVPYPMPVHDPAYTLSYSFISIALIALPLLFTSALLVGLVAGILYLVARKRS